MVWRSSICPVVCGKPAIDDFKQGCNPIRTDEKRAVLTTGGYPGSGGG